MNYYASARVDDFLIINNDGPLIQDTNFWETKLAQRGLLYVSTNSGAIRLLIPDSMRGMVAEMERGTQHVVLSYLKSHLARPKELALEILFEDGSDSPLALHSSLGAFDCYPAREDMERMYRMTVWEQRDGKPYMRLDLPAFVRTVYQLPCLQPWKGEFPKAFSAASSS